MKASIIVPIYNAASFLPRTIEILRHQTLSNIEIILVNDGSSDDSLAGCTAASKEDSRIQVISQENAGVSVARNRGIQAAKGDFLLFCDADDIPAPDWAEELVRTAEKYHADISYGAFEKQSGQKKSLVELPLKVPLDSGQDILQQLIMPMAVWNYPYALVKNFYGSTWRSAYKHTLITEHGVDFPRGIGLGEDLVFNIRALSHAHCVAFTPKPVYTYVENLSSATHSHFDRIWQRYKKLWMAVHSELKQLAVSDEDLRWHNWQLRHYLVNAIVEGILSSRMSLDSKKTQIRQILCDEAFDTARKDFPRQRECFFNKLLMRPVFASLLLRYLSHKC